MISLVYWKSYGLDGFILPYHDQSRITNSLGMLRSGRLYFAMSWSVMYSKFNKNLDGFILPCHNQSCIANSTRILQSGRLYQSCGRLYFAMSWSVTNSAFSWCVIAAMWRTNNTLLWEIRSIFMQNWKGFLGPPSDHITKNRQILYI